MVTIDVRLKLAFTEVLAGIILAFEGVVSVEQSGEKGCVVNVKEEFSKRVLKRINELPSVEAAEIAQRE